MKRFFLIPLMAFFSCVMAFATVRTAGTIEELQSALADAQDGDEIQLTADIDAGTTAVTFSSGTATLDLGEYTLSSSISASGDAAKGGLVISGGSLTIKGNGSITAAQGNAILVSGGALIVKSGTISGGNEGIFATAGTITVDGGTMNGAGDNAIFTRGQALTINGGTFTGGWGAIQADNNVVLTISGGNFTGADQEIALNAWSSIANANPTAVISGGTFNGKGILLYSAANVTLTGGTYANAPDASLVSAPYFIEKVSSQYKISNIGANVAVANYTAYATLEGAVDAASPASTIIMYANDNSAVPVAKNLIIDTKGYSATGIAAADGYSKAVMGQKIVITDNAIAAFLMADGPNSMTIEADADIASAGTIHVNGDKTLTINEGVTVTYKRQGSDANIVVDAGAKLTVLGKGTFRPVASQTAWNTLDGNRTIDNYGTLVIGVKDDAANCPVFYTTSLKRGSAISTNPGGSTTINNVEIYAACAATWNTTGTQVINGGRFLSISNTGNGYDGGWYSYMLRNELGAHTIINDGFFQGVQGCFDADAECVADIYGGTFHAVYGLNLKEYTGDNAWAEVGTLATNHYAFYVATGATVNVYGGDFWSQLPNAGAGKIALVGNNDAYNYYGIVNLYGGRWQKKVQVQARKNKESYYPESVPANSQWYGCFGSLAPLPAGYEYYETGDATYPWGVRAIPGAEVAEVESNETTIPWQQNTTWDADWTGGDEVVPENNTIVTIPVGKTVVVDKTEAEKNAVAKQVFIAQGATLKIEEGTALTVGDGGVNIGNGGKVLVEQGAVVKIGAAGVITTDNNALVLESTEDAQAVLLYDPAVTENTQPKATVKLTTKSKQIGANSYVFERFAIPTVDGEHTSYSIEGGIPTTGLYNDAPSFLQAVWGWNHETQDWYQLDRFKDMEPYKGYQLTNNTANGGLVYVFEGNLVGNADGNYNFVENGFHFFGNSYTADINIKTFLASLGSDVEKTVWVYDPYDKNFKTITERLSNGRVKYGNNEAIKDIRSMQAFLMYLSDGASGTATVNYESAIWGNPKYNPSASPAPARERETVAEDWATIKVASANGQKDEFILLQSEEFSNAFENGADASKFMNKENINLYATTNVGNLAMVATDNIDRTVLAFAAGEATEYTISFEGVEGNEFTLRDIVTGAVVSMTEGATYTFTQEANTTNAARFEILGSAKLPTAIENVEADAKAHGIYTIAGQFVGNDFNALSSGVYVVNGVKIVK